MAEKMQKITGSGQGMMGGFDPVLHEIHHRSLQIFGGGFYAGDEGGHCCVIGILITKAREMLHKAYDVFSTLLPQLAAHQIQRLHPIGALVDHCDTRISGELRHAPIFDVTMAAEDLLRLHGHRIALIGQKPFDHRGQKRNEPVGGSVLQTMCLINQTGGPKRKRPRPFDKTFLIHKAAADVGMHNQRIGGSIWVFDAGDVAALQAFLGVDDRILIGGAGLCQSLHADTQARLIHHGEHRAHALVHLSKQIAGGAVVIHDAGCIAMNPHFPLNRPAGHSVALANAALGGDNKFRHNEQ